VSETTYLTPKERVGYEAFLASGLYAMYNLLFTQQIAIDIVVFCTLLGSLFLRYHLVVSDETISDSKVGQITGSGLSMGAVVLISYLCFKASIRVSTLSGLPENGIAVLIGSTLIAAGIIALAHHRIFRYDEQREDILKSKAETGGATGLMAEIGLSLGRVAKDRNFDPDIDTTLSKDELRSLQQKVRAGEVSSEDKNRLKQIRRRLKQTAAVMTISLHILLTLGILAVCIGAGLVYGFATLDILSVILLVTGIHYSFSLQLVRFGLRKLIDRPMKHMPLEIVGSIWVTYLALFNSGLVRGDGIIVIILPTVYLLFPPGYKASTRIAVWLSRRMTEDSDQWQDLKKGIKQETE
jgi:hypothetical protein